ncbi:gamma-interferon-inducible lysosomal thiol reductase [Cherax quadricarinatus]|uniref:gamma-interferon-inducible lysosomal thiol reductase n=1 Tax=Cherax quadricarinatus TaxID=27406 RepID=UPI00387E7340
MIIHITLLLLGLTASPCLAEVTGEPGAPVKVSVYYETLCPDSQRFITNQLYPVWLNLMDIMEIDINAYGKANDTEVDDGYVFECQHGPDECEGNIMMACAREYIEEDEFFMTFLNCIMSEFEGASAGELVSLWLEIALF